MGIAQMWEGKRSEGVQLGLMSIKLKEAMYEEWDLFKNKNGIHMDWAACHTKLIQNPKS